MSGIRRFALTVSFAASVIVLSGVVQAANVAWTIDSTATTLGASGTGIVPLSGLSIQARLILQGTSPLASATPVLPIQISGSLITDTDFTSSIRFLATGTVDSEITGDYKPMPDLTDAKAPGDVGFSVQGKVFGIWVTGADAAIRDLFFDFSGPSPIAISGGSFPTTGVTTSVVGGRIDYRGFGIGSALGSGSELLTELLPGDANYDRVVDGGDYTIWADNYLTGGGHKVYNGDFSGDGLVDGADYTIWADNYLATDDPFPGVLNAGADATISVDGGNYKLTMPILAAIALTVDEGDDTATTTDDIYVDFKISGTVIATTPIPASSSAVPEPTTLGLSLIGALGAGAIGLRRRFGHRR